MNLADDAELLQMLRAANFFAIFVGIESPDTATLISMQKKQNTRRSLAESVHKIYGAGMFVLAGFIIGFDNEKEYEAIRRRVREALRDVKMLQPLEAIREAEAIELAWHIRDGLLGIVGEMRPQGTNLIIEDVCFPPAQLANATRDLLALLAKASPGQRIELLAQEQRLLSRRLQLLLQRRDLLAQSGVLFLQFSERHRKIRSMPDPFR